MSRTLPHRNYELLVKTRGMDEPWRHVVYIEYATRREVEDEMAEYARVNTSDMFKLRVVKQPPRQGANPAAHNSVHK